MNDDRMRRVQESPRAAATSPAGVARTTLVAVIVVALALAAWTLSQLLLALFGAVLVAAILVSLAKFLERRAHLPKRFSLAVAVIALVALLVLVGWLAGDRFAAQLGDLRSRLPQALDAATRWLAGIPLGALVLEDLRSARDGGIPWANLLNIATVTLSALGTALLVFFVGIFLAASPGYYRDGLVRLFPKPWRSRAGEALDESGEAVRRWLAGQLVSMLFVGVATAAGLALIGIPLALTFGLIAGLLDFVPFFGPMVAGALAILFAFIEGPREALYVLLLFVVIQQLEGNVLLPLIQRWAVALPPVLGIVAAIAFGLLFGLPGVLLATPLMVVTVVLVKKLYIEDQLER